ncbi:MAG TPA: hypothetical protein VJX70_00275 [Candidatus Acidoferrum sp.]|nr:hypothetical protein [Candidatus Acidoferrum sp.]
MTDTPIQLLKRVNACLAVLLEEARRALRGEGEFGVAEVRKIREPLEEMAPLLAKSAELRRLQPELNGQLDLYKSQLGDLQSTVVQIRLMLLARQASLEAGRVQVSAVSRWVTAFRQTR